MRVAGIMTWSFQLAGNGVTVQLTYVIGGYNPGGFKDLARGFDGVLGAQLDRYKRYVETGKP